jgi:hypothetical protein
MYLIIFFRMAGWPANASVTSLRHLFRMTDGHIADVVCCFPADNHIADMEYRQVAWLCAGQAAETAN